MILIFYRFDSLLGSYFALITHVKTSYNKLGITGPLYYVEKSTPINLPFIS